MKQKCALGSIFTNIFLAALIISLYHAVQPGVLRGALPAAAPAYRGSGEKAALQFSVCWNAGALSDIIEILHKNGVRVTFAVSGEWAEQNQAMLRRMREDGHEIATLGYHARADGGIGWLMQDISHSVEAIEHSGGVKPRLYCSVMRESAPSAAAAKRLELTQVGCTIDLLCARGGAEDILLRIPAEPIAGSIIQLEPTAECEAALEGILAALEEKGLKATYTSDVLA